METGLSAGSLMMIGGEVIHKITVGQTHSQAWKKGKEYQISVEILRNGKHSHWHTMFNITKVRRYCRGFKKTISLYTNDRYGAEFPTIDSAKRYAKEMCERDLSLRK